MDVALAAGPIFNANRAAPNRRFGVPFAEKVTVPRSLPVMASLSSASAFHGTPLGHPEQRATGCHATPGSMPYQDFARSMLPVQVTTTPLSFLPPAAGGTAMIASMP
jgi:hypothetical protein